MSGYPNLGHYASSQGHRGGAPLFVPGLPVPGRPGYLLAVLLSGALLAAPAWCDTIIKRDGTAQECELEEATWEKVSFKFPGVSQKQDMAASEIQGLVWSQANRAIINGVGLLESGKFEDAEATLKGALNAQGKFGGYVYWLLARAQLALGARTPAKFGEAMMTAKDCASKFKAKKDFYVPHCAEVQGLAAIAAKDYAEATKVFQDLASGSYGAHWKSAGDLGQARTLLAQEKFEDARRKFSEIASAAGVSPSVQMQANLGYAQAQFGMGSNEAAAKHVREKILESKASPPTLDEYRTRAFILWGDAQAKAGGEENMHYALVRYFRAIAIGCPDSELLAEATYKAMKACEQLGWQDKAQQLKVDLGQKYPKSPWNR
ncbi:MAG: tetratricopeptide repeat protein [Planctomycetota bacterium]